MSYAQNKNTRCFEIFHDGDFLESNSQSTRNEFVRVFLYHGTRQTSKVYLSYNMEVYHYNSLRTLKIAGVFWSFIDNKPCVSAC